jgi:hypothetical protein
VVAVASIPVSLLADLVRVAQFHVPFRQAQVPGPTRIAATPLSVYVSADSCVQAMSKSGWTVRTLMIDVGFRVRMLIALTRGD